jgi:hypothetical protein
MPFESIRPGKNPANSEYRTVNVTLCFFQECALGLRETAGPGKQHFTVNVTLCFFNSAHCE